MVRVTTGADTSNELTMYWAPCHVLTSLIFTTTCGIVATIAPFYR